MNTIITNKEYTDFDLIKVKQQLNLIEDDNSEDNFLKTKYIQAVALTEGYLQKDVALTTKSYVTKDFNSDTLTIYDYNFIDIISISGDTLISGYTIDFSDYNNIEITFENTIDVTELKITYRTGYIKGNVPNSIECAIMIKITDLYSNRGSHTLGSYKETGVFEMALNSFKKH